MFSGITNDESYDLTELDKRIASYREQQDKAQSQSEKDRLQRLIDLNHIHERAAIQKAHAEKREREAREAQAMAAHFQKKADEKEASDRRMLRMRWSGDESSFNEAYPELIKQLRIDRALGRGEPEPLPFSAKISF